MNTRERCRYQQCYYSMDGCCGIARFEKSSAGYQRLPPYCPRHQPVDMDEGDCISDVCYPWEEYQ